MGIFSFKPGMGEKLTSPSFGGHNHSKMTSWIVTYVGYTAKKQVENFPSILLFIITPRKFCVIFSLTRCMSH